MSCCYGRNPHNNNIADKVRTTLILQSQHTQQFSSFLSDYALLHRHYLQYIQTSYFSDCLPSLCLVKLKSSEKRKLKLPSTSKRILECSRHRNNT